MNLPLPDDVITFLLYLAIFVGILLVFDGLRALLSRLENPSEARNRRMRMVRRGYSTEDVLSVLRDPSMQDNGKGGIATRLRRLVVQSGAPISLNLLILLMLTLAAGGFIVAMQFLPLEMAAGVAVLGGLILPIAVLELVKKDRMNKLELQLPEALSMMARSLRVGHPLAVTVGTVAEDMPDPIGSEFGIIQDQVSFGDEIAVAFQDFAERAGTEDARYLAVSVGIQHSTGGNLARVLEILAKVIRDRQTMHKKIKAISSEGRLSGLILTFLPLGIFLSIHSTSPGFYGDVANDPLFRPFVIATVSLVLVQALILKRLVSFKF